MQIIGDAGNFTAPGPGRPGSHWAEHLRSADLSVGTYSVPAGGTDDQVPHTEDEIYVVTAGHATLVAGGGSAILGPGAVVFVPAGSSTASPTSPATWRCSCCSLPPRAAGPARPVRPASLAAPGG